MNFVAFNDKLTLHQGIIRDIKKNNKSNESTFPFFQYLLLTEQSILGFVVLVAQTGPQATFFLWQIPKDVFLLVTAVIIHLTSV